jgi:UDP-N-acetyl-2-amino-2-deoxyglucuronate dehydrogenase
MKFALVGAAGYVAPRHMKAIKETGNDLVAAADLCDSVGILDSYFPDCQFFTSMHHFWEYVDRNSVDYVSICSPNHTHYLHCIAAMDCGANVICEKPLTINTDGVKQLAFNTEKIPRYDGLNVNVILQLRISPVMIELKDQLKNPPGDPDSGCDNKFNVTMKYVTPRGPWYHASWKGDQVKSGGILMNIGIHLFDILLWLFGDVQDYSLEIRDDIKAKGKLVLQNANVDWFLSLDRNDLPNGTKSFRSMQIEQQEIRFDKVFADLHTRAYSEILKGNGFGPLDALPSIALVEELNK